MSNERREAKALDEALNGTSSNDETRPLVETADHVRRALETDVPPADRMRALFISGVSAREKTGFSPLRILVPALAMAVIVFAAFAGQYALPGEQLYPVREALNAVGIGDTPLDEIEDHLHEAGRLVNQADEAVDTDPERALSLAVRALEQLGPARDLLPELNEEQREDKLDQIEDFEDGAIDTIEEAIEERQELEEEAAEEAEDNRDSGSDDSGGGDNSGSGSDDSGGDDNSGSGSDDSDDSSGSGSGSDDSSGSGSGGDDGDSDDSSGSGSGSDDSSGSG
jgi:hypothetical protein